MSESSTNPMPPSRPMLTAALAEQIERRGPRLPLRVLAVLRPEAGDAQLRALLSEAPVQIGRRPAPRVLELELPLPVLDALAARDDVFEGFEAADRLVGESSATDASELTLQIASHDVGTAERTLRSAGGRVVGRSHEGLLARAPADAIGPLLLEDAIDAVQIVS